MRRADTAIAATSDEEPLINREAMGCGNRKITKKEPMDKMALAR